MNSYEGNDNYGRPKYEYVEKVSNMTYKQLMKETESKIWLSAYANNNPRSDYHWHVDVLYAEWLKRDGNDKNYSKAYKNVTESL